MSDGSARPGIREVQGNEVTPGEPRPIGGEQDPEYRPGTIHPSPDDLTGRGVPDGCLSRMFVPGIVAVRIAVAASRRDHLPSGLNATPLTSNGCPPRVCSNRPVS